jgi:hypothetical protein
VDHRDSANTDCNHLAAPRVFYLLSAIVPRCQARPGAITCWSRVNRGVGLVFTLTADCEIHDVARAAMVIELRSHL